jgi:hypothetical protein
MSFGGNLAKDASDELQKAMSGMSIPVDDDMDDQPTAAAVAAEIEFIVSSASSMTLEEARAEVKRLKTEMYVMELQKKTKKVSPNQLLHTRILGDPVVAAPPQGVDRLYYFNYTAES